MTRIRKLRIGTASLTVLLVVTGTFGVLRYGYICSLAIGTFSVTDPLGFLLRYLDLWRVTLSAICPLGFLERTAATGELLPYWPSFLLIIFSVILLGRVFCAWICPSTLYRKLVRGNPRSRKTLASVTTGTNWSAYSSYAILGGVLIASYLFRFPVFCLACPVGLFFGSAYAVFRIFTPDTPGLELVIFPLMLGIEMWGMKSWCRKICPLGALLSIFSAFNPFFRPTVSQDKCFAAKGINCHVCAKICPEGIDLKRKPSFFAPNSCTKCMDCSSKCPVHAVKFPLLSLRRTQPQPATAQSVQLP